MVAQWATIEQKMRYSKGNINNNYYYYRGLLAPQPNINQLFSSTDPFCDISLLLSSSKTRVQITCQKWAASPQMKHRFCYTERAGYNQILLLFTLQIRVRSTRSNSRFGRTETFRLAELTGSPSEFFIMLSTVRFHYLWFNCVCFSCLTRPWNLRAGSCCISCWCHSSQPGNLKRVISETFFIFQGVSLQKRQPTKWLHFTTCSTKDTSKKG